ncbi:MAG: pilus assembly protein [Henriciella sp.]|uniref:vWA domain-containing protein n=1 Tax=Henriciella sp. TaxID=1968823 RepID=UPI0032EFB8FC
MSLTNMSGAFRAHRGNFADRLWRRSLDLLALDRGHVAVILALAVLPIALVSGFAIDFQLLTTKKNKAQYNLDSAVIAGTRALREGHSHAEVKQQVSDYFMTALSSSENFLNCESPTVVIDATDVEASTRCSLATTLSAIAGVEEMSFQITTATTYGIGKVDVAFVFDVSGSMGGSRIADLKLAAHDAVNTLIPDDPAVGQEDDIRISMVAYNGAFNAGSYFQAVTGETPEQTYWYRHDGEWRSYHYSTTCVFERAGGEAFTDAAPGDGQYLMAAGVYERNDCSNAKPLELTSDETPLHDYIETLSAGGNTAGHLGVAWGWYTISPNWAGILPETSAPLAYDEPDSAKAIVLMTDGAFNTVGDYNNGSSSWQARQLCDAIKQQDIVIYSVAFQAPSSGEDVLRDCASGEENFFTPQDGEELTDAYQSIATAISDLRITH